VPEGNLPTAQKSAFLSVFRTGCFAAVAVEDGVCKLQLVQSKPVTVTGGDRQCGSPLRVGEVPRGVGHGSVKAWSSYSVKLICSLLHQRAEIFIPGLNRI